MMTMSSGCAGLGADGLVLPAPPVEFGKPVDVPTPVKGADARLFAARTRKRLVEANLRLRNDKSFYDDVQRRFGSIK
jgi:hypothetical protein